MRKIKFALIGFLLVFVTVLIISGVSIAFDPVEDLGPVDFEGATVTYVSAYDPLLEFESGERYAGRLEEAKEKFNIGEIEYVNIPWGETKDTVMSRLMSGDSKYDIWILPTGGAQYYDVAAEGALYPVDQVLPEEYYQSMPQGLQIVYDRLAVDGNKYDFGLDHYTMINYIAWNKELFERESLTPLDELYKEGEWNWETMEEIAVKATRDTSGNDEIDQWGLGQEEIFCWIISNHGSIIEHDEYGDFKFVMHEDEASIYAIDKYEEWESELQIIGDDYTREAWRDGQIAMSPIQFWEAAGDIDDMEEEWGVVPFPMGPDADTYTFPVFQKNCISLPLNSANSRSMVALHKFLFPLQEMLDEREEDRIERAPDETAYEVYMKAESDFNPESLFMIKDVVGPTYDENTPLGGAMTDIKSGEDVAPTLDSYAGAIQSRLDDYFEQ